VRHGMVRETGMLVKSVAILLGTVFAASFLGAVHPVGDSLAVGRMPFAVLFALCVIWTRWPIGVRLPLVFAAMFPLAQVVTLKLVDPAPGSFAVYQKNIWVNNLATEGLAADILTRAPDVVTLQEVSDGNVKLLDLLAEAYPYQVTCGRLDNYRVAVLSRHAPIGEQPGCLKDRGIAVMRVDGPDGPVWVVSVHLVWPWPDRQLLQTEELADYLAPLEGPIVLAGDFNMTPWGQSVRRLARSVGGQRAGPLRPSYWLARARVPLPIDHVFAPGGGDAELLPRLGSDHLGVFAWVHLDAN